MQMKKFFQLLFSRFTLVVFAIILQLGLYIFLPIILNAFFPLVVNNAIVPLNIIIAIISMFVVIWIINSDITIEGQLPLIILCIIMPLIGIVVCMVFVKVHVPRKIKKNLENTNREIAANNKLSEEELKALSEVAGEDFGQFKYIYNTTNFAPYQNSSVKFLDSGEKFLSNLLQDLKNAKKYIFMEYFIVERGKMWQQIYDVLLQKTKEGVEVRLMYDDLGTMAKLPSNFAKKLKKQGIKCVKFNEYSSATSALYNNRDHRKITVIDGKVGYIGGINIADEYANYISPYGVWKDSAVRLQGEGVKSLVCLFLQLYDIQTKQTENFSQYFSKSKTKGNGLVCPFGDGPKYFYKEHIGENVYLNMINSAKKYIYISTPYLIIDSKIKAALISASKRGVDVRIVTPHIPDKKVILAITRSHYKNLSEAGVKIFEFEKGFIHSKQVLVDDKLACVGTINFDYRSLIHHYECGMLMQNTKCLVDIKKDFEKIFKTAINMAYYKQNAFVRLMCALLKLFFPLL